MRGKREMKRKDERRVRKRGRREAEGGRSLAPLAD